jgi:hypothetical protein
LRPLLALVLCAGCYDVDGLSHNFVGDGAVDLAVGDLAGADFAGVDLAGADLAGVDLAGADLSAADLSGPDLGPQPDLNGLRIMFLLAPARAGDVLSSAGGIAKLDQQCNTAAAAASLSGSYVALIADSTISGTRGLTFTTSRPIVLPSGTQVSNGLLFSGSLLHAIDEQADRSVPVTPNCAWTGFDSAGTAVASNCQDWTIGVGTPNYLGGVGDTRVTTSNWAHAVDDTCNFASCFVYCLEQ